ncbi:MAG: hypothetical protein ACYDCL_13455 [Myxococcales bacterium]
MYLLPSLAAALALAAPASPLLVWVGGNDAYTLTLLSDGSATYQGHSGGWGLPRTPPPPKHGRVSRTELAALHRLLLAHHVLALRPSTRPYVPEERDDTLDLFFPDLRGRVDLKADDWSNLREAKPCAQALEAIANRIGGAG